MAAGLITRVATFLLLLAGAVVVALFAVRLVAVALGHDFSPFRFITSSDSHTLLAWLLVVAMVVLVVLISLVLRHGPAGVWLMSEAGDGGVLVPQEDLERLVSSAAGRAHPDVLRVRVELSRRGAGLRGRIKVWARPLADREAVRAAVEERARRQAARLTRLEFTRANVSVKVLRVQQLVRYLP